MTRFWMLQLHGRKLVRLLPPSENARATPADGALFQLALFPADLMSPDFSAHPQLDGALVYEALLEAGDVLFVPEGWAHQTLNVEWGAMVSANYMDQHAVPAFLDWAQRDTVRAPRMCGVGGGDCALAMLAPAGVSCRNAVTKSVIQTGPEECRATQTRRGVRGGMWRHSSCP